MKILKKSPNNKKITVLVGYIFVVVGSLVIALSYTDSISTENTLICRDSCFVTVSMDFCNMGRKLHDHS